MLKDEILRLFIQKEGNVMSLNDLANTFDVSRNSCWKAINKLIDNGYNINLIKNKGYSFERSNIISKVEIDMYTHKFNCLEVFETIDSTNTYMKNLNNKQHRDFVVAKSQTNGRGRRGKSFVSTVDKGVYFTFFYNKVIPIRYFSYITICSAIAIKRALLQLYDINVDFKWLNDIYFNNKKLAGILTEVVIQAEEMTVNEICIGIGLNTEKVDTSIEDIALSIEEILNLKVNKNELIANIMEIFENVFEDCFESGNYKSILDEYKSSLFIIGKEVEVNLNNKVILGTVVGVNDDIELILDSGDETYIFNNGEVSVKLL